MFLFRLIAIHSYGTMVLFLALSLMFVLKLEFNEHGKGSCVHL